MHAKPTRKAPVLIIGDSSTILVHHRRKRRSVVVDDDDTNGLQERQADGWNDVGMIAFTFACASVCTCMHLMPQ